MRHKNSFPPRLTENEARNLEGRYSDENAIHRLLNRGLLRTVGHELIITRRGELMLTRYRRQDNETAIRKLARQAA
jgi:hypothetical protein